MRVARRQRGRSVPGAADAVPGDVAREPLGVDLRDSSRSTFSAPHFGHGGAGFVEVERYSSNRSSHALAAILVDRHGRRVYPACRRSRSSAPWPSAGRRPDRRRPRGVLGFLGRAPRARASSRRTGRDIPPAACTSPTPRRRDARRARRRDRRGELSPREAVQDALERIERDDAAQLVHHGAGGGGARRGGGAGRRTGPLHGVPIGVKDVIDVAGTRTTAASRILADNVAAARRDRRARGSAPPARSSSGSSTPTSSPGARSTTSHALRPGTQPLGHRADLRRLERRQRRRGRGRPRPRRARHRHGRLGPHPGRALRRDRAPADDGPRPEPRRHPGLVDVRHRRPARAHRRGLRAPARRDRGPQPATRRRPVPASRARGDRPGRRGLRIGVVAHLFDDVPIARRSPRPSRRRSASSRGSARASSGSTLPFLDEAEDDPAARDAPGGGRGAPPVAAHPARRLRRRRARAPARRPAPAGLRADHRASGRGAALALEARPLFERFDLLAAPAMPIVAPRIGEDPVEVAGQTLPYRLAADPVQLAVELLGRPDGERPVRLRRRPARRARARRAAARRGDRACARRTRTSRSTDWHERRPPDAA